MDVCAVLQQELDDADAVVAGRQVQWGGLGREEQALRRSLRRWGHPASERCTRAGPITIRGGGYGLWEGAVEGWMQDDNTGLIQQ